MERTFDRLAKGCAILAGVVVVAITLVTTWSIVGRAFFSSPLLGDTEIVEFGMAVVVACCLPLCQWRGDNIIVDFFTAKASPQAQARMDRLGSMLVGVMMALIAWRTAVGTVDQQRSGSVTMLLQWPEWVAYAVMTVPLAITSAMGFYTGLTGRNGKPPAELDDLDPLAVLRRQEAQS